MGKKAASRNQEKEDQTESEEGNQKETAQAPVICGLVMPISEIDGCSAEHWVEVRDIIEEALAAIDIETRLVSDGDEVGIIQERIVQNLYDRPIVVCDVSCKNPNVMFELGLRLAFDMPTIILKDDNTNYTFDINVVEHIGYPRDLNYWSIQAFKELLAKKVKATLQKKIEDDEYSPFLKAFNKKRVAGIETKEVTSTEFIMDELKEIRKEIRNANRNKDSHFITKSDRKVDNDELNVVLGPHLKSEVHNAIREALDSEMDKNGIASSSTVIRHLRENYPLLFEGIPSSVIQREIDVVVFNQ